MQACAIPKDALLDPGRIVRRPLAAWSEQICELLAAKTSADRRDADTHAGLLNNAALVQVFAADLAAAADTCELQIEWLWSLSAAGVNAAIQGMIMQPWINLGRLARIRGELEPALERFRLLELMLAREPVKLGSRTVSGEAWAAIEQDGSTNDLLQTVYVYDSVRTFLAQHRTAEAHAFIGRARVIVVRPGAAELLNELEILSLCALERYEAALAVIDRSPAWSSEAYTSIVRATYRASVQLAMGRPVEASRLLDALGKAIIRLGGQLEKDLRTLRLLTHLALLAKLLDRVPISQALARTGLELSRTMDDVLAEIAFLDFLLDFADEPHRDALVEAREQRLRACQYPAVMRAHGIPVGDGGASIAAAVREAVDGFARSVARVASPQ